jgi:cysteine desulfurase
MIYLDNHATTVPDPRVINAMTPWFGRAANMGSPHAAGKEAREAVERARGFAAEMIGCGPREIIFTSGATESNNIVILGAPRTGRRRITCSTEHASVLRPLEAGRDAGWWDLTILDPGPSGHVEMDAVSKELDAGDVEMAAFMLANNETGAISPVSGIGTLCRKSGTLFHCDAVQGAGKIAIPGSGLLDTVSVSGHKIHGPQGIGALFIRRGSPKIRLSPSFYGGGQERNLRPGTVPVALAVGFGEACRLAVEDFNSGEAQRTVLLRTRLLTNLRGWIPDLRVNGPLKNRLPNNLNLVFPGIHSTDLVTALEGQIAVSAGSACSSMTLQPSRVLLATGVTPEDAACSIRFGIGRFTTELDIDRAVEIIVRAVARL